MLPLTLVNIAASMPSSESVNLFSDLCVFLPFERDGRIQKEPPLSYFLPGTL